MGKVRSVLAAVVWLALSHFAVAAEEPPKAKIDAVAWLTGYWDGEGMGGQVEDAWLPPRDGVMLGAFRLIKPDGGGFYELFAIEEWEGSLRFRVKHFEEGRAGSPRRGPHHPDEGRHGAARAADAQAPHTLMRTEG